MNQGKQTDGWNKQRSERTEGLRDGRQDTGIGDLHRLMLSSRCSNPHLHTPFRDYTDGFPCFRSLSLISRIYFTFLPAVLQKHSLLHVCRINHLENLMLYSSNLFITFTTECCFNGSWLCVRVERKAAYLMQNNNKKKLWLWLWL